MDDFRARDIQVFLKSLFSATTLTSTGLFVLFVYVFGVLAQAWPPWMTWLLYLATAAYACLGAFGRSLRKRFRRPRMWHVWQACVDRHRRFHQAVRRLRKSRVADLAELPSTIDRIHASLYVALRRADIVQDEVASSEGYVPGTGAGEPPRTTDSQALALYRLADRNIAEYHRHYNAVIGSVQRTEAQAAVYTTTLDSLRMKMLGYRLVGTEEPSSLDFLSAITEAKMQLEAVDRALEELEMTPFPKMVAVVPESETDTVRPAVQDEAPPVQEDQA